MTVQLVHHRNDRNALLVPRMTKNYGIAAVAYAPANGFAYAYRLTILALLRMFALYSNDWKILVSQCLSILVPLPHDPAPKSTGMSFSKTPANAKISTIRHTAAVWHYLQASWFSRHGIRKEKQQ